LQSFAITVDEMRAAQALIGFTPKEMKIPNLLHELPRGCVFIVQCLYHRELQLSLRIFHPGFVLGQEYRFNNIVAHNPWVFILVSVFFNKKIN
jgi:hypothetical protein